MIANKIYDMIIIGGGPAGYTAALYAARSGLDCLVVEKLSAGGQMALTHQIDNYPGFPEGIDEAVNAFVASSNSEVFMLEFENILHQNKLQNLPGTDMENPNWRTKLPEDLEDIRSDKRFIRNIDVVKRYRF